MSPAAILPIVAILIIRQSHYLPCLKNHHQRLVDTSQPRSTMKVRADNPKTFVDFKINSFDCFGTLIDWNGTSIPVKTAPLVAYLFLLSTIPTLAPLEPASVLQAKIHLRGRVPYFAASSLSAAPVSPLKVGS